MNPPSNQGRAQAGMLHTFISVLLMSVLFLIAQAKAGDFVQWTDETGVTHFADSLESVPSKYRAKAKQEKFKEEQVRQLGFEKPPRLSPQVQNEALSKGDKPNLSTFEVPFEAYEGDAQRVIVSVTFNGSVTVPMAIDTGAPGVIISPRVAKKLGLYGNAEGMVVTAAGGIGGVVPAIRTFLDTVEVGGAKDSFIPATIADSISGSFDGLIGMVFMSKYSFKIDSVKQVVIFEEVRPDSRAPGGRNERWWRSQFKELNALRDAWGQYASHHARTAEEHDFASRQAIEADKLLGKLDRLASQYFVPQTWR